MTHFQSLKNSKRQLKEKWERRSATFAQETGENIAYMSLLNIHRTVKYTTNTLVPIQHNRMI